MPYRLETSHANTVRAHTALVLGSFVLACSSSETESPQNKAGTVVTDYGTSAKTSIGSSGAPSRVTNRDSSGGLAQNDTRTGIAAVHPSLGGAGGVASSAATSDGGPSDGGTGTTHAGAGGVGNATGNKASTRGSGGRSSSPLNQGGSASGSKAAGGSATSSRSTNTTGGVVSMGGTSASGAATSHTSTTRGGGGAGSPTATGGTTSGTNGSCAGPRPGTQSKNPLFTDVYTADPSAMVHNCTFYIHCGHDEGAGNGFVMNNWYILKSTDMVNWTRIDRALTLGAFKWANANAWAGQMITKGGKFYWFVPVNKTGSCPTNCGMAIGVAVGDSPEGPFTDYLGKPLIDDILEMANWGYTVDSDTPFTIDPTVFADDDGQVYLQYGGFGRLSGVKLVLDGNKVSLSGKLVNVAGLTGFFEAPFLTKIRGTYYNVYARDSNPAKIDYATASNPMGPFTYRGRILDSLPTNSTDAATSHPAIAELAGQWYLVYHLSNGPNGGGTYHRMVAVDKLTVASDGTIAKSVPTLGMTF